MCYRTAKGKQVNGSLLRCCVSPKKLIFLLMSFDFDIIMEVYFNDYYLNIHPIIMIDAIQGTMVGKRLMYIKMIYGRKEDYLKNTQLCWCL